MAVADRSDQQWRRQQSQHSPKATQTSMWNHQKTPSARTILRLVGTISIHMTHLSWFLYNCLRQYYIISRWCWRMEMTSWLFNYYKYIMELHLVHSRLAITNSDIEKWWDTNTSFWVSYLLIYTKLLLISSFYFVELNVIVYWIT